MVSYNTPGHKPEKYIQDYVSIKPKWSGIWNRRRNLIHSYNVVRAHDFHPVSIAACYSHGARIATVAPAGHWPGSGDPSLAGSPGQSWDAASSWRSCWAAFLTPLGSHLLISALGQVTAQQSLDTFISSFLTCLENLLLFAPRTGTCRRKQAEVEIALVSLTL